MPNNPNLDFLKLKVFLYKYTPNFTPTKAHTLGLFKADRYKIDLDEKFFSKYDITNFVVSYTFEQDISANTYAWTLNLHDRIIPFQELNTLRIKGPAIVKDSRANITSSGFDNLAKYEAQAKNIVDTKFIENAKIHRGIAEDSFTIKVGDGLPKINGLRLSDLIQTYDLISCFLYKSQTPVEDLRGGVITTNGVKRFVQSPTGRTLSDKELQDEQILLSVQPGSNQKPLFSNEFNGFVFAKTINRQPGAVDSVSLTGYGTTRLFGSTRRLLRSSIMQQSIYDISEIRDPDAFTAYQNIYVNKKLQEIFTDLFDFVYRIKFKKDLSNFYDFSSLVVGNSNQTNLFSIPPYLLASVMKLRGFNYREPIDSQSLINSINSQTQFRLLNGEFGVNQVKVNSLLDSNSGQNNIISRSSPVSFAQELNELRPYFIFIEDAFAFFNAELKTPFEIIDEIKEKTFLEFFERPDGVVIIRAPQYNDTTSTIFSSNLDIVNTSYSENIDSLVSRQSIGYGMDIIRQIEVIQQFFYTNGKLLIQYGFLETSTDINPNVKNDKTTGSTESKDSIRNKEAGIFKYAEYFLRLYNAALKTGTLTIDLRPEIIVGQTFFDERNNKFGYITNISKTVDVTGTATMTLGLGFVRDGYLPDPNVKNASTLQFEQLTRLIDIASSFKTGTV